MLDTAIEKIVSAFPDVIAIYVFGSFGTEYETATSDIDLAALFPTSPDTVTLWNHAQEIAIELKRDVDLVDLRKASTVFQFQILSSGKRIYCSDPTTSDFFENTCLSMYVRFNEERKDLIENG